MNAFLFPGQGSQHVGMGDGLFDAFPDLTAAADAILGYSIKDLCLKDPDKTLGQTQFTQPALFVVNALACRRRLEDGGRPPDFTAGHSLGEYNALECAGVFSFEDGLRLVQRRSALMAKAKGGGMAAILGIGPDKVAGVLSENGFDAIDVANYNGDSQTVISGLRQDVDRAQSAFEAAGAMFIPLNVSGAFHSRYMQPAGTEYARFLADFTFAAPRLPVMSNVTALPYQAGTIRQGLSEQLTHCVRWAESMHYLLDQGVTEFTEVGPRDVLTKLIRGIRNRYQPSARPKASPPAAPAPVPVDAPAPLPVEVEPSKPAAQRVADWNAAHPVGTRVRVKGYAEPLATKTEALVLFGHRAAVYMQGYNGYFALDEVRPA
ncbi:ACP S-malonyltransferase [Azospirillum argentinense]|uniref:ACP S-malonyltransferase n=1 Tax=Azospirillum argentinense TaxID=2970906 RepID=UPI0032E03D26